LCSQAVSLTGERKICLAGGVALNCTANAKLRNYSWVEDLFVFPAAGDAGSCIGAALFAYFQILGHKRNPTPLGSVNFGPGYSQEEVDRYLCQSELPHKKYGRTELLVQVASMIRQQKVVGWFQGKMEFGPRALGNRSILGDPTRKENWKKINQKVKFREDFRPLAPAVTADQADHYFEIQQPSPFMLLTSRNKTALLPAVTHVDGSSRLQTVNRKDNPLFYDLIVEFGKLSGVPVLINTSFNTAGMPIVCTPQNALQCFVESELDVLVLGQCILEKGTFPFSQEASNVLMPPLKNELRFSFVRLGKRMWVYWNSMAKLLGKPFQYLFLFVFYFFVWGCTSMGLRLVKKFLKRNQNLSSWAHLTSSTTCSDAYYQS